MVYKGFGVRASGVDLKVLEAHHIASTAWLSFP